jgi:hypothetical protein
MPNPLDCSNCETLSFGATRRSSRVHVRGPQGTRYLRGGCDRHLVKSQRRWCSLWLVRERRWKLPAPESRGYRCFLVHMIEIASQRPVLACRGDWLGIIRCGGRREGAGCSGFCFEWTAKARGGAALGSVAGRQGSSNRYIVARYRVVRGKHATWLA